MPRARVSDSVEIEYELIGDPAAPTVALVMGFTMQLIAWDVRFCEAIAAHGFRVLRFDNRDVGLSTKLTQLGVPDLARVMSGDASAAAYRIDDMAGDLAGLLRELDIASAHIVGASMGGFIVQETAIHHGDRVKSVTSIMSSTGDRSVGYPRPEALAALMGPPPMDRSVVGDHAVRVWKTIGSPGFPFDETRVRERAIAAWDRGVEPGAVARQMAAIVTQRDRTADLQKLRLPAAVIHGADDPLIHVSGGEATARAIPGAVLTVVPGMGHDFPEGAWPAIVDAIVTNTKRAAAS